MRNVVRVFTAGMLGVIPCTLLATSVALGQSPKPRPAIDAIFKAFDTHSIVLLGEVHWNLQQHRFIQRLLRDPRLPNTVSDIAVEFGNSLYQPLIDRYVAGDDVPLDSFVLDPQSVPDHRCRWSSALGRFTYTVPLASPPPALSAPARQTPATHRLPT